jgi:hypothetical protein
MTQLKTINLYLYSTSKILHLVDRAVFLLSEGLSYEKKASAIIEKTGLLGHFIRCVPVDPERSTALVTILLEFLHLVKKKLKWGARTGDLNAVITGKDGPINEKAKSSLVML